MNCRAGQYVALHNICLPPTNSRSDICLILIVNKALPGSAFSRVVGARERRQSLRRSLSYAMDADDVPPVSDFSHATFVPYRFLSFAKKYATDLHVVGNYGQANGLSVISIDFWWWWEQRKLARSRVICGITVCIASSEQVAIIAPTLSLAPAIRCVGFYK